MNHFRQFLFAFTIASQCAQAPVDGIESPPTLSADQVCDLLLSSDRDDHRRGVAYVFEAQPDVTSQVPRLIKGLAGDERMVAEACCIGLSHGRWDSNAMTKHIPSLLDLLGNHGATARRGATAALSRIAPDLRDRLPDLIAKASTSPEAVGAGLAISKKVGLSKKQWIAAWLPATVSKNVNIRDSCRYAIRSVQGSSRILVELIEAEHPEEITAAILEILATYRQKPKATQELVIRMLGHRSPRVRAAAIGSLEKIPHDWAAARKALLSIAQADSEELRAAATSRLFRDPSLRKTSDEKDLVEQQVARYLDEVFSDNSPIVRRAACFGAISTPADQLWVAKQLVARLEDTDDRVRLAARGSLGAQAGLALYILNHDPDKVEQYYREQAGQQGKDNPAEANEWFGELMSEFERNVVAQRAVMRFLIETAKNHESEQIREQLSELQTAAVREESRKQVPAAMRRSEIAN